MMHRAHQANRHSDPFPEGQHAPNAHVHHPLVILITGIIASIFLAYIFLRFSLEKKLVIHHLHRYTGDARYGYNCNRRSESLRRI